MTACHSGKLTQLRRVVKRFKRAAWSYLAIVAPSPIVLGPRRLSTRPMPHDAAVRRLNPGATPHLLRPLSSSDASGFPLQQPRSLDAGAKRQVNLATKRSALKQVCLEAAARRQISSAAVRKGRAERRKPAPPRRVKPPRLQRGA